MCIYTFIALYTLIEDTSYNGSGDNKPNIGNLILT